MCDLTINERDCTRKIAINTVLVIVLVLVFYVFTLAPTVLWGDDAELQRLAILNETGSGIRNYGLWRAIAHEFTRIPYGDIAWRVNLACAVFAALTVGVLFVIFMLLRCSLMVAWAGCIAFSISHTFWLHAVRAEVYSLFILILALTIALLVAWHHQPKHIVLLSLGIVMTGFALLAHMLIVTFVPAIVYLIVRTKKRNALCTYIVVMMSTMIGLVPYWITRQSVDPQVAISNSLYNLLHIKTRDIVLWLGFLGYQFLLLTPMSILGLMHFWKRNRTLFLFFGLAFTGNVLWTWSFQVPDQYVFYLPSYLVFVLWVGKGVEVFTHGVTIKAHLFSIVLMMVTLLPLPFYRLTPVILNQLKLPLLPVRTLPYRDNNLFFFYPPKTGYYGARFFGESVMASLPPNAAVLADHSPLQTLRYFQEVENKRQDIVLADSYLEQGQLAWLVQQSETRPVFIADNENIYYDMDDISRKFEIKPFGSIFLLERKP